MTEDSAMTREGYVTKYGEEEGIRRWKQNEYGKRWYQEHREEQLKQHKRWHQEHREYMKRWRQEHREYHKQYHQKYREERLEYMKQYQETPNGRARHLISSYRQKDRRYNRGDCTLTAQWVVDNIFTKKCLYCGEEDWKLLGTDRINNNRPHTPENVVCSCEKCNKKRHTKDFLDFAYSIGAKDSDELTIKYYE